MSWVNFDDVVRQLEAANFKEPSLGWAAAVDCGKKAGVKCKVEGLRQGGAIALHTIRLDDGRDALIGAGWYYKAAEKFVVKIELRVDAKPVKLSKEANDAARARLREMEKAAEADQQRKNDKAARQAMHTWGNLLPAGESAYLKRKGVDSFGVKFSPSGALVVPMTDTHGRIHGLQIIRPDKKNGRDKDFWPTGLAKKGHFHVVGAINAKGVILIAEGYATAASLHMAIGLPVVVAFDAGNLGPVAAAIHAKYKTAQVLVCADDDFLTEGNPGIKYASTAALAVGGAWVAPAFAADRGEKKITDFNDLHSLEGLGAVRAQIEAKLAALGWQVSAPEAPRAGAASQGGGGTVGKGRRAALSVMELDDLVARFVPLDDGTGDYVFDTWTNKVAKKAQMIALLPAGVRGDDIKRHPVWYQRGAYYLDQVGFDPAGDDPNCKLNTWQGWPMEAKAGKCDRLLELLRYLCSGEEAPGKADEVFNWLLCWMAYPLQNPGAKMASAVIMHGPQGTGKSTVFQSLAKIYGDYSTVLNQRGLEDKFNSDWSDSKLFILAEEVVTRAEMWHIKNELKELVTGEWIRINPKNIAAYRQRNQVNICYLSNEGQPLPLDNDDRRHCVIYTPGALSESYYDEVFLEIEHGGVAALYQYLLDLDLSGFHPKKRPPMTEAKQKLMLLSSPSEIRFVTEWVTGEIGLPVLPCLAADLYGAYLKWCRANGESRPRPSNQFHGAINHLNGWEKKKARIYLDEHSATTEPRPMVFPPQQAIDRAGNAQTAAQQTARWLTDCANKFTDALKNAEGMQWAA
jgi:putative DNA primase/helicase